MNLRAERRAAPELAHAKRRTRPALRPSMLALASMEPRPSFPPGDRPLYSAHEGLQ